MVNLIGEMGIGKSRLVAELRAQAQSPLWLEGRAAPVGESSSYHNWAELLRDWLGGKEGESEPDTRHKLRQRMDLLFGDAPAAEPDQIYPYLAALLSLELDARDAERLAQLDPKSHQTQTFLAVHTWLERLSQDQPLVAVFEDLQWADDASVALLQHIVPLVTRARLLLVNVFRLEQDSGCWQLRREGETILGPQGRYSEISLDRLSPRESDELIQHLLADSDLPVELMAKVGARAEGNPLFTEEIVRSLVYDGILMRDATHGVWLTTTSLDDVNIPSTLQDVFSARISHLTDAARRVLEQAAVIGRVFWDRAVAWVAETPDLSAIGQQIEQLEQRGLIQNRDEVSVLGVEYRFKHALAHQVAYDSIPETQRRTYHRRVAEFIEKNLPDRQEHLGLLVHHALKAGEEEKACRYAQKAAQQAADRYHNLEAVNFYQQALSLLPATDAPSRALRFDLLHGLQIVQARLGQVHAQERTLNEMLRLASLRADSGRLVEVYIAQAALYLGTNLKQAEESARSGLRLARVMNKPGGEAQALLQHAWVHRRLWRKRQAISQGEAALAASRRAGDRRLEGRVLCDLAGFHAFAYDFENALNRGLEALEISQAQGDRSTEAKARLILGRNLGALGRHSEAVEQTQASVVLARQIGDRRREATSLNALGRGHTEGGNHDQAIETFREALSIYRQIGDRIYESWLHGNIGWMHIRRGDFAAALDAFQKSHQVARRVENRSVEARALLAMASLHRQVGQFPQARRLAQTARSIVPQAGQREIERWALGELSLTAWWQGEFSLALGLAQTALGHAYREQDQQAIGWDVALLAGVHQGWPWFDEAWGVGSLELALRLAARAESIGKQTHDRFVEIWGVKVQGAVYWRLDQAEKALDCCQRAIALLKDTPGYPDGRESLYFEHSLILRANGLGSEADGYLERAHKEMIHRADLMSDPAMRRTYLDQVPVNRAIRDAK